MLLEAGACCLCACLFQQVENIPQVEEVRVLVPVWTGIASTSSTFRDGLPFQGSAKEPSAKP